MAEVDVEQCWICLEEEGNDSQNKLFSPCKCPRKVHPQCMARWQLQQAGKDEEKHCRFCKSQLEDWKAHLTPETLKPEVSKVQPIMVVYFEGQIHRIPVKNGPDGLTEFTTRIRELFRLPEDVDISLTFGCKEPMSGQHLKLEGVGAFDAAVHCASVAAADRQMKVKKSASTGNLQAMGPGLAPVAQREPRASASQVMDRSRSPAPNPGNEQERRRRLEGGRAPAPRSRSFTTRERSGAAGSPTPQQLPSPSSFRNILSMLNTGGPAGGAAAGQAPGVAASPRPAAGAAGSQAAAAPQWDSVSAPQQSARSVTEGTNGRARESLRKERLSSRNIALHDVPESDETVAVGSLSGFKLRFKAFSRKVARSLSFTNKHAGFGSSATVEGSTGSGSSSRAGSPLPPLPPRSPASPQPHAPAIRPHLIPAAQHQPLAS